MGFDFFHEFVCNAGGVGGPSDIETVSASSITEFDTINILEVHGLRIFQLRFHGLKASVNVQGNAIEIDEVADQIRILMRSATKTICIRAFNRSEVASITEIADPESPPVSEQ